jgi:3-hydroxybutyryl-CoA dehydratase
VSVERGTRYRKEFAFSLRQVRQFAELTGDSNPIHLDKAYAETFGFKSTIVHGFLVGSVISRILGTEFPGEGTIYLAQTMSFKAPVFPDEKLVAELEVLDVTPSGKHMIKTVISSKDTGEIKLTGEALVLYRG